MAYFGSDWPQARDLSAAANAVIDAALVWDETPGPDESYDLSVAIGRYRRLAVAAPSGVPEPPQGEPSGPTLPDPETGEQYEVSPGDFDAPEVSS